jgi:hypothetical protein
MSPTRRNKRKRDKDDRSVNEVADPNDRLSTLAAYISVYG